MNDTCKESAGAYACQPQCHLSRLTPRHMSLATNVYGPTALNNGQVPSGPSPKGCVNQQQCSLSVIRFPPTLAFPK
jgi:hypothetical protein